MFTKISAFVLALSLAGCGTDEVLEPAPQQDAAQASLPGCLPDGGQTGHTFQDSVTVKQSDGTTCVATGSVDGRVAFLDCPCTDPLACTAADRYLHDEEVACGALYR